MHLDRMVKGLWDLVQFRYLGVHERMPFNLRLWMDPRPLGLSRWPRETRMRLHCQRMVGCGYGDRTSMGNWGLVEAFGIPRMSPRVSPMPRLLPNSPVSKMTIPPLSPLPPPQPRTTTARARAATRKEKRRVCECRVCRRVPMHRERCFQMEVQ